MTGTSAVRTRHAVGDMLALSAIRRAMAWPSVAV